MTIPLSYLFYCPFNVKQAHAVVDGQWKLEIGALWIVSTFVKYSTHPLIWTRKWPDILFELVDVRNIGS